MKISKSTEKRLVLEVNVLRDISPKIWTLAAGAMILAFFLLLSPRGRSSGGEYAVVIFALFWVVVAASGGGDQVYRMELYRDSRKSWVEKRAGWRLWIPRKKEFALADIVSLSLDVGQKQKFWGSPEACLKLRLRLQGGTPLAVASDASMRDGETLSQFLNVPLEINTKTETITIVPWDDSQREQMTPLPCMQCGAPLPAVQTGDGSVTCEHCGVSYLITWKKRRAEFHLLKPAVSGAPTPRQS